MVRKLSFLLIATALILGAALSNALAEETAGDYFYGVGAQMVRGLENVVTSPAEIPCTISSEIDEKGGAKGSFTGFGKGTVFMLRRMLVGVCEVGTFFLPAERSLSRVCQKKTASVS